jgi:hypothetical protein
LASSRAWARMASSASGAMPFKAQKLAAVRRVVSKSRSNWARLRRSCWACWSCCWAGAFLLARFAVGLALGLDGLFTAGLGDGAAAGQLVGGHLAVFFGQLAGRLAVQIETLGALRDGRQVRRGARVATEEGRQGLLAELAGGALLDVDLDAQLERLGRPLEQGGEQLGQTRAGGGGRGVGLGCRGLGRGRVGRSFSGVGGVRGVGRRLDHLGGRLGRRHRRRRGWHRGGINRGGGRGLGFGGGLSGS